MKLIRAHIRNFRLLKDLSLDFSVEKDRPLTVIRAANETGKTTCEYALMWGLYGSKPVLPNRGEYSLFPADLKSKGQKKVDVSVEVEFEVDQVSSSGKGSQKIERKTYRIVRSCVEKLSSQGSVSREAEAFTMHRLDGSGTPPVPEAEAKRIIENALPVSLKDVYFTDGDQAMSFIEAAATQGVKRKRVSNAVEALLGLEDLKKTERHLDNVAKKFATEIDDTDYAEELEKLNDQIGGFDEDIAEWEAEVKEIEANLANGTKQYRTCKAQIEEALKLGDRAKLSGEIQATDNQIRRMSDNAKSELVELASLLSGDVVSKAMLKGAAKSAMDVLTNLSKNNKLPKANIPILEELLDRDSCFCGADLSPGTNEGKGRRSHISAAIEDSREADAIQEVATSLFYRTRSVDFDSAAESWVQQYEIRSKAYQNTLSSLSELDSKRKDLKALVDGIDDSRLVELREQEDQLERKLLTLRERNAKRAQQIAEYSNRRRDAIAERNKVEKKCNKTNTGGNRLSLARRAQEVFRNIIEKLKQEELVRVSDEMNRIFLEMIGSDPESNDLTLITKAELTEEYDIRVYGPTGHELNPDQDLNGASRRAITLAFILALTKVSEVEAPNVIDTPLGMMAGFVKQSVLMQTLKEGSQAILFLTHDEIMGVEDILDKYAGKVFTLTNPAHYPRMLKNKPDVSDSRIVRCECSHRETCSICERKDIGV